MGKTSHSSDMRGFSLIEMLVSVLIFSLVVLAVYFLFDQGQWLYLYSEKRGNVQENARLITEQMERDFQMIGAGVPLGQNVNTGTSWAPSIFAAGSGNIAFTADLDNGTRELTENVGEIDNAHIFIGVSSYYTSFDADRNGTLDQSLRIILVSNRRAWEDLTAISLDSNDRALVTSSDVTSPGTFLADRSTVHTLERVFYRMIDQSGLVDNDGICTEPYPFCTIQRQEYMTNDPTETNPEAEAAGASWVTLGTNVTLLKFDYYTAGGTVVNPASGPLDNIDKITVTLVCRERANQPQQYQDATLKTEVLIRNKVL